MPAAKILAFSGSSRRDSFNQRLVRIAATGVEQAGGEVTLIDLADFPLPIFNEDLEREQPLPNRLAELKRLFAAHDGLLIACPEYNSSITPLLKNTIDWVSRATADEPPLAAYRGKVAGLLSASPGPLGGLRGLVHVRAILGNIGVLVLPEQVAVGKADQAFDSGGKLSDPQQSERVIALGRRLAEVTGKCST